MSTHPTLINLPPPPSDPLTPSDMGPGTPNSATTTMSELSTVAIKDGHRGHIHHHHNQQANPLDAERADRISRLAGLERVAAARHPNNPYTQGNAGSATYGQSAGSTTANNPPPVGYFDNAGNPQMLREKSTVGSASATGSVGGRTTWASGSEMETDRFSEQGFSAIGGEPSEVDMDTSSVGGLSHNAEGAEAESLVGFGEGARTPARTRSPGLTKAQPAAGAIPSHLRDSSGMGASTPMSDTAARTPPPAPGQPSHRGRANLSGAETSQSILSDRMEATGRLGSPGETEGGAKNLGKFDFEGK